MPMYHFVQALRQTLVGRASMLVPLQAGFTSGRPPMRTIEAHRSAAGKAKAWGHNLLIGTLDVDRAFDHIGAYSAGRARLEPYSPPWAIALCGREWFARRLGQLRRACVATFLLLWEWCPARRARPPHHHVELCGHAPTRPAMGKRALFGTVPGPRVVEHILLRG